MENIFRRVYDKTLDLVADNPDTYNIVNDFDSAKIFLTKKNGRAPIEIGHIQFIKGAALVLVNNNGVYIKDCLHPTEKVSDCVGLIKEASGEVVGFKSELIENVSKKARAVIKEELANKYKSFERETSAICSVNKSGEIELVEVSFFRVDENNKWHCVIARTDGLYDVKFVSEKLICQYSSFEEFACM